MSRFLESFGLEGTFKGHLVQPPCSKQGHLQLGQVAQSPVQPELGLNRNVMWKTRVPAGSSAVGWCCLCHSWD